MHDPSPPVNPLHDPTQTDLAIDLREKNQRKHGIPYPEITV